MVVYGGLYKGSDSISPGACFRHGAQCHKQRTIDTDLFRNKMPRILR